MTEWNQPDQAERFVREYADPILRVCAAYSLGRSDAQDICQDIFLTLLEGTRNFDTPDHERAFILRCAINACKDILKSSRFRRTNKFFHSGGRQSAGKTNHSVPRCERWRGGERRALSGA